MLHFNLDSIIHHYKSINRDKVPYQRAYNSIGDLNNNNYRSKMPSKSSFPKRTLFYKIIGPLAMIMMVASITILMAKRCTQAITNEWEARQLQSNDQEQIKIFMARFFLKLHILHCISLLCILLIILYCYVDLVPKHDIDRKYAFHFFSIFVVFCVSISTMYASFVAFERPCLAPEGSLCCQVIGSPRLLGSSDKKSLTSISTKETSMIAVMVLDLFTAFIFLVTTVMYFRDVRQDAAECGYLYRVHNESYIIR